MPKAYIVGFESRESANHEIKDYQFSSSAEDAMPWSSKTYAETEVLDFNRRGITINADLGRPWVVHTFQVEEREPGVFIIAAEGPFVERTPPTK